jgi:hypothetical protein
MRFARTHKGTDSMSTTCSPTSAKLSPREVKELEEFLNKCYLCDSAFKTLVDQSKGQIQAGVNKSSTETVVYNIPNDTTAELWNFRAAQQTKSENQKMTLQVFVLGLAAGKTVQFLVKGIELYLIFNQIFPDPIRVYPKWQIHYKTTFRYQDGPNKHMYGRYTITYERMTYDSTGSVKEHLNKVVEHDLKNFNLITRLGFKYRAAMPSSTIQKTVE